MVLFEVANLLFLVLAAQAVPAFQADCENTQTCLATFTNTYTTLCNQNSEFGASDCSQLELHINGLESFMEKICAATAVITHTSRHNYRPTWYPLVPITMGSFDVGRTSIQTFHLPFTVAHSESIEVLIYVWIKVYYLAHGDILNALHTAQYCKRAVYTLKQSDYYIKQNFTIDVRMDV